MKTHIFTIALMMAVLSFAIYRSVIGYENFDIYEVLAINLAEIISVLIVLLNFMKLVNWKKFNIVYHTRMLLILAFVGVVLINSILFTNVVTQYLYIPSFLLSILGVYFVYTQQRRSKSK